MQITRLRVAGFKSFPDPVEILIEAGLTGIVGPNGCGKSNIVEALRWAMGESSARGLRGDEMADVIFSGTTARPAHDVAEVRLKLSGRAGGLAGFAAAEEIEIARRIARGVGSSYRINGKEARARDVQLLFADAAAGARSPAIIGQGQIGFVTDAKPAERRRLLEDAAGIGGLQTRRREAELKLEATQANLQRVLDLLREQEARLAELGRQSRQAARYRQLAGEIRRHEALLLLSRYAAAAELAAAAEAAERAANTAHRERVAAATACRNTRAGLAEHLPTLRERLAERTAEAARIEAQLLALREAAEREAAHRAALARQREEVEGDLAAAAQQAEALTARAGELANELAEVAAALVAAEAMRETAASQEHAAAAALAPERAAMHAAMKDGAAAEAQHAAAGERRRALEARRATVERGLAALPSLAEAEAARSLAAEKATAAARALSEARAALALVEDELRAIELAREDRRRQVLTADAALAAVRQRLAAAELTAREAAAARAQVEERRRRHARDAARLAERQTGHAARTRAHERNLAELDVEALGRKLAWAEDELRAADGMLDAARAAMLAAEAARGEVQERERELRRAADALKAEIRVLESLAAETAAEGLLDRLEVAAGLDRALAAALGDDLLAGTDPATTRFWRGPPAAADVAALPPLPAPARPLLALIEAPSVLRRRLSQVGLVDAALAAALQAKLLPGQRLVSPDGGLWRWDGFVRTPAAEDRTGAGVRHRLRLQAAREEAAALAESLVEIEDSLAGHEAAVGTARAGLDAAEQCWRAADAAQLRARQQLDEAQAARRRLDAEGARLAEEEAALAQEAAELAAERAALEGEERGSSAAGLQDAAALAAAVQDQRTALAQAEAALRAERAELARLDAAHKAATRKRDAGRATIAAAEAALERARAEAEATTRHAAELAAARQARESALAVQTDELAAAAAAVERELAAAEEAVAVRRQERAAAEAALAAAETAQRAAAAELARWQAEAAGWTRRHEALVCSLEETQRQAEQAAARRAQLAARRDRLAAEAAAADHVQRCDPELLARHEAAPALAAAERDADRAELTELEAALAGVEAELAAAEATAAAAHEALALARSERRHAEAALASAAALVRERLQREPVALLAEPEIGAALAETGPEALEAGLVRLRAARERLGPVNLRAEAELAELEAAIAETRAREAELSTAIDRLNRAITTLNREGRERLMAAFAAVDGHFGALFARLFGGGRAQLRLLGADDPLHAGLELEASPPGKKLAGISLLSGGEKTLTALALVFAFFLAQPSPLCVLDEVDAPLDDANVERFVALMQEIAATTGTRFLVVTHHPLTMARMDRLYGVTMAERGVSRLVSVALEQALQLRATA